jgi:uncharacterized protein YukE
VGIVDAGPCPEGDPEAIRAVAAELRGIAGRLAGATAPAVNGWRGPAAAHARAVFASAAGEATRTADDLRACATSLDNAAHTLEADQRAWRRKVEHERALG